MTAERLTPGEVLRRTRENAGWSTGKLARAIHLLPSKLSDIERDRACMFPPDSLRLVARTMDIDEEALVAAISAAQKPEPTKSRPEDHPAYWPTYQAMFVRCLDAAERRMAAESREREEWPPCEGDPEPRRDTRSAVERAAERASTIATEAVAALVARDEEREP